MKLLLQAQAQQAFIVGWPRMRVKTRANSFAREEEITVPGLIVPAG